jgi:hypothetical protein
MLYMPMLLLLRLTIFLVTDLPVSSGQRLVGVVNGVYNAGLLNVYRHSSGGPLTTYVAVIDRHCVFAQFYRNAVGTFLIVSRGKTSNTTDWIGQHTTVKACICRLLRQRGSMFGSRPSVNLGLS